VNSSLNGTRLGPSYRWAVGGFFFYPLVVPCILLTLYSYWLPFRNLLWDATNSIDGFHSFLRGYFSFQRSAHIGSIAAIILGMRAFFVFMRHMITRYEMDDQWLYVTTLQISFSNLVYRSIVAKALIYDIDEYQNIFQSVFGTGNLIVRTSDRLPPRILHYVPKHREVQEQLREESGATRARVSGII